ncbi:MAG TPA: hypothetical protein VFZ36_02375 [Vicinamibacterales bacterium]
MRPILRRVVCAILLAALGFAAPAAAQTGEKVAEGVLDITSKAQNLAEQLAEQQGRFLGRKIGPKLGSVTNSLLQILTDFDVWACGSAVTALGIRHRQLVVEAARAIPADPAADRLVSDLGELIARLQELCNQHVFGDARAAAGANRTGADAAPPTVEEPPQPEMSVQERICQSRCQDLYVAYLRAEAEYDRAQRAVQPERDRAAKARREADLAAERAREADARSKELQRERERLRRIIEDPSSSTADRMAAAEAYGKIRGGSGLAGPDLSAEAERAAAAAREAEARAARAEARASALYDALMEIYNAWLACIRTCVQQAKLYNNVDVDPQRVFPGMPTRAPVRPPFYRQAPSATPAPTAPPPDSETKSVRTASRITATPMAFPGGTLVGAVYDSEGEPREDERISVTEPGGRRREVRTGAGGQFSLEVPKAAGTLALAMRDSAGQPVMIRTVAAVPSSLPASIPEFVALGSDTTVAMPYRAVAAVTANGLAVELPKATALTADGRSGITSFRLPESLGAGPVRIRTTGMDGQETTTDTASYAYVRSWIDQNELRSGQNAAFGFEVDFGTGPMNVVAVIVTEGPIVYDRAGQPQVLEVNAEGRTVLTGHVRAVKGSPTGIPFSITATFSRAR